MHENTKLCCTLHHIKDVQLVEVFRNGTLISSSCHQLSLILLIVSFTVPNERLSNYVAYLRQSSSFSEALFLLLASFLHAPISPLPFHPKLRIRDKPF